MTPVHSAQSLAQRVEEILVRMREELLPPCDPIDGKQAMRFRTQILRALEEEPEKVPSLLPPLERWISEQRVKREAEWVRERERARANAVRGIYGQRQADGADGIAVSEFPTRGITT